MQPKTVVVIPAFNEEVSIGAVLDRVSLPVIVVDDASDDNTEKVCLAHDIIPIRNDERCGAGASTRIGISVACYRNADTVVTLDADGQHDPAMIPKLLTKINEGYDLAMGLRGVGWRRGRIFASWIFNFATGVPWWSDSQSGFKAMNARTALIFCRELRSEKFAFCSEMLILAKRHGLKIAWVPVPEINTPYSLHKPHRQQWFHAPKLIWDILKLRLSRRCAPAPESLH